MRIAAIAVAVSIALVGLSVADEARAAIRKTTNIPQQKLGPALRALAKDRNLQVLFRSQLVRDVRTTGAVGVLTTDEALSRLLSGTTLTFQYLDDNTITIVSVAEANEGAAPGGDAAGHQQTKSGREGSFWDRFRLAQVDQGQTFSGEGQGGLKREGAAGDSSGTSATQTIDEIVVTAQKRRENLNDVPISIAVLGGDALDRSTFTGALEALKTVPGVTLLPTSITGGTMLNVRGVGAQAALANGSSPVGYYLDGVPFSLIRDAILPDQNAFDLQQIEVLRGPQGTLHGANSANGLVRVLTRDADLNQLEFKTRTTLSDTKGAEEMNYRADGMVNVPLIEGKLAVRAVAGYDSTGGWIANAVEEGINTVRTRNYRLKVNAQPTDALSIGLSSWISRIDKGALSLSDKDKRIVALVPQPAVEDYDAHNLELSYDFSSFSFLSSTSYLEFELANVTDTTNLGIPAGSVLTSRASESVSQEFIVNSTQSDRWKWTVGAFYRAFDSDSFQGGSFFPRPAADTEDSTSMAVFGQVSRRFWNNQLEWTLGARYFEDEIDLELDPISVPPGGSGYTRRGKFHATTPRVALTWYPGDTVTVYASYAQGFRSGLPTSYTVGVAAPSFPDTKPDLLDNYEIGAKADLLNRRLSLEGAVYYIDWQDVQQAFGVPFNGTFYPALTNGESASGAGVDFSATAYLIDGLEVGLKAGWNDLTIDEEVRVINNAQLFMKGDRLNLSPELTSGVHVIYGRPLGSSGYRGELSVSATYISKMTSHAAALPTRLVVAGDNLTFGKASFMVEAPSGWSAALFVDNFTDEDGLVTPLASTASLAARDRSAYMRPRTIGIQVDYRFH